MDYYVAVLSIIGIHILLGLSVYLVAITGQLSFGQQGLYAIGAYLAGMCTALWGFPLFPALLVGMTAAGIMGFLVGFPCLRVKGLYLGIATLGFGEIVRLVFLNIKYTKMIGGKLVGPNGAEGFRHVSYIYDRGITQTQYLGPDQGEDLAAPDLEIYLVERADAAEVAGHALDGEHHAAGLGDSRRPQRARSQRRNASSMSPRGLKVIIRMISAP